MNNDRMEALKGFVEGLKALREQIEALEHGSADEKAVFNENGRFWSEIVRYQRLFEDELFDEFGVEPL